MDAADVEPEVVRLREDAAGWRRVNGPEVTPDDPFLVGLSAEEADALVGSQWALVPSTAEEAREFYGGTAALDPPVDPADYTVDELRDELDSGDYSERELDALADAERSGKDRETAMDAIEAARAD